ncbi:MAG: N-acetylmannosamine-6-phosphate 2-epimerase [Clostridiales bacterium]|nr:N-acetylmannosamine-6-phosphate 2-epimerase [Clostridiales bacterium]
MSHRFFDKTRGGLIVSCQALPEEPLHSSYIMSRMAYAAMLGGASGIRANTVSDIKAIKETVNLPIIGIIKKDYPDSDVYITPTMDEVDELVKADVDVIAMDATSRRRPGGKTIAEIFPAIRRKYPDQLFMADCATYSDAVQAKELGFDIIGTTLCGYTPETRDISIPDLNLIEKLCSTLDMPIIAEGGIWSPETLTEVMSIPGIFAAVVGSAITRPMEITKRFVRAIRHN